MRHASPLALLMLVLVGGGCHGSTCHTTSGCSSGDVCLAGGVSTYGGLAVAHDCENDKDCDADGGSLVCVQGACGATSCAAGCTTDTECSGAEVCQAHHCICTADSDCGANEACTSGSCAPKTCAKDSDCSGYCVDGSCSSLAGVYGGRPD